MKPGLKYAAAFIPLLALSVTLYLHLRWPSVEKKYISYTEEKVSALKGAASRIDQQTTDESLAAFYVSLMDRDQSIAAIATADFYGNVRQIVKNDSFISSGQVLDRLLAGIKAGSIQSNAAGNTGISEFTAPGSGTGRFYVFSFNTVNIKFIAVYVFRPARPLAVRIILELVLVCAACFMITGIAALIISGRKVKNTDNDAEMQNIKAPIVRYHKKDPDTKGGTESTEELLDRSVFSLFRKIHRELSPENVSLYIRRADDRLCKSYELRGSTFLRVDAPVFESIAVNSLAECSRPGIHITGRGGGLRIPMFHKDYLNGMVEVTLSDSASSLDIAAVRRELDEAAVSIQKFIVTENIIMDPVTGFFTRSHLRTKLGEQVHSFIKNGTPFSLMVTDVFGAGNIDADQKTAMMKLLFPAVKKATSERFELFSAENRIVIIMDRADRDEAEIIRRSLIREIGRYRIKSPDGKLTRLTPVADYTMSYEARNVKDILQETVDKTVRIAAP